MSNLGITAMGENIPAPANGAPFNLNGYMTSIGRNPPPVVRREDIEDLPAPQPLDDIYDSWVYEPKLMSHDGEWKVAVNSQQGGNVYFAAIAMLIYGDSKWWFWVRIQHLQFFEQVIRSDLPDPHPRREVYRRFNSELSGPNNFSLHDRLKTTDCWVDHQLLSQITADLYGIYLFIYTYHSGREGTQSLPVIYEAYSAVQARGNYNAPHRFLRYMDNRHYQPIVPAGELRTSKYSIPELKVIGEAAALADPDLASEENDGINHPWRMPYPDVPIPNPLVPTPITTLVLKDLDRYLSTILWVKLVPAPFESPASELQTPQSLRRGSSQIVDVQGGGENSGVTIKIKKAGKVSSCDAKDVKNPTPEELALLPSTLPTPNYFRKSLKELEKLISERNIKVPDSVRNIKDSQARKKRYAAYLEGDDVENGNDCRRLPDIIDFVDGPRKIMCDTTTTQVASRQERSGGVLRQITTTTTTRVVTSVPSKITSAQADSDPLEIPLNGFLIDYQEVHLNTDEKLQQLLLGANLDVAGNRETDIEVYRAWMRDHPRAKRLDQSTSLAEVDVDNDVGSSGEGGGAFNSTVNVDIYSVLGSRKPKQPSPSPEPEEFQKEPIEEEPHLEVECSQSSPEPESSIPNDYSRWSAAALKRDAAARDPPIKIPAKQKAEVTKRVLAPRLQALNEMARAASEDNRAGKRARAEERREEAKRGGRLAKRIKLLIRDKGKDKEVESEEVEEGEGNREV